MAEYKEAVVPLDHGDWKTASVHPDRWPTIKAGTVVEEVGRWTNCYGQWVKIIGPNGEKYDVRPSDLHSTARTPTDTTGANP